MFRTSTRCFFTIKNMYIFFLGGGRIIKRRMNMAAHLQVTVVAPYARSLSHAVRFAGRSANLRAGPGTAGQQPCGPAAAAAAAAAAHRHEHVQVALGPRLAQLRQERHGRCFHGVDVLHDVVALQEEARRARQYTSVHVGTRRYTSVHVSTRRYTSVHVLSQPAGRRASTQHGNAPARGAHASLGANPTLRKRMCSPPGGPPRTHS